MGMVRRLLMVVCVYSVVPNVSIAAKRKDRLFGSARRGGKRPTRVSENKDFQDIYSRYQFR
jgi:hypothetical protein